MKAKSYLFLIILLSISYGPLVGQITIWADDFSSYPDATLDAPGSWSTQATDCDDPGLNNGNQFGVFAGQFRVQDVEGAPCCVNSGPGGGNNNFFETVPIDISNFCDVSFSLDVDATGDLECLSAAMPIFTCTGNNSIDDFHDQFVLEYDLDGTTFQAAYYCGQVGVAPVLVQNLNGNSLTLRFFASTKFGSETYIIDDILVQGFSSAPVTAEVLQTTFCTNDPSIFLDPIQDGVLGSWSGPGVSGNTFDPAAAGLGNIQLIFTPNQTMCIAPDSVIVEVFPGNDASWNTTQFCDNGGPYLLEPAVMSSGQWSGIGVTDNGDGTGFFDPSMPGAGLVTYIVGSGPCADTTTQFVLVTDIELFLINDPLCDDNGTPTNSNDDTYTIEVIVLGSNPNSNWVLNDPAGSTGPYNELTTIGPFPISSGANTLVFSDALNANCTTNPYAVNIPNTCSDVCLITSAGFDSLLCFTNNTPDDITDDFITFFLNPTGNALGAGYTLSTDFGIINPSMGFTGSPSFFTISYDGLPTSGSVILQDLDDPNCVFEIEDLSLGLFTSINGLDPSCFGIADGQIQIDTLRGGVAPYTYAINSLPLGEITNFPFLIENLTGGPYHLSFMDQSGCTLEQEVNLVTPPELTLDLENEIEANLGQPISLYAVLNFDPSTIFWAPNDFLSCSDCLDPVALPLESTQINLIVSDENGCTLTDSVQLLLQKPREVFIPNIISPNGDGANDFLDISGNPATITSVLSMEVYDRWGALVFRGENVMHNQFGQGWDGTIKGKPATPGTYVYKVEVLFIDGFTLSLAGSVQVIR